MPKRRRCSPGPTANHGRCGSPDDCLTRCQPLPLDAMHRYKEGRRHGLHIAWAIAGGRLVGRRGLKLRLTHVAVRIAAKRLRRIALGWSCQVEFPLETGNGIPLGEDKAELGLRTSRRLAPVACPPEKSWSPSARIRSRARTRNRPRRGSPRRRPARVPSPA